MSSGDSLHKDICVQAFVCRALDMFHVERHAKNIYYKLNV